MTIYVCVFEPTLEAQKDGAVPLAIALEANSVKMVQALAIVHLGEEYPEDMDKFNTDEPIICEDRTGSPRPPVGKFDEKFASEYEFNGTTWQVRALEQAKSPAITYRDFTHTYATLDLEIALALLDGDFHCWGVLSHSLNAAKKLIADNDEAWRRWSTAFRIRTDALSIPRETIFSVVREGKRRPELLTDTVARREYLNAALGDAPTEPEEEIDSPNELISAPLTTVAESIADNLQQTESPSEVEKTETKPRRTRKNKQAEEPLPSKTTLPAETSEDDTEETNQAHVTCHTDTANDNFQYRANILEEAIKAGDDEQQTNLRIWKVVQRTDPRFTKPLEGMGFSGTSINSNYMFMRATEIFGPVGKGWGYQVMEEKMINGAPLSEPVYDSQNKQIGVRILRDSDGTLICEQNHSLKILFWYLIEGDIRGEIESYGATPYLYKSKNGIKADSEVIKKSLTDAIKKALSMLGFSADVFMGMHDNPEYLADNKIEFGIKAASDKAEDWVRLRKELDDKFTRNTETMRTAVSQSEIRGIASTLTRELGIHLENAKAKADKDYEKYLSGRLRRLTEIEKECLAKLEEEADQ
ncbi:hypothetical protein [Xenorhabdus bovienii]|uniref:hypothetical protein n=1 Tax=Xenorhabdus bovienii TaxID=40576 RepID=UPI0004D6F754|nr:hypothetical protein [Xenorhabdus bovienii]CDG86542.1 Similarities with exodeoxyribonuclease VIII [Xenorhabdus bovienii str. feltiae France]CDG94211.1 Similarities with exodeoxyribonuclease VIII [Xenorhabdus bovienii str. feltiae Florida]